ncbi:MAG TPA: cytochrome c oxidase assembly factor Coa1 family protein [Arenimonas sp.]|nr:cytochrome c oxidase assembly factor Coa1 family protein [Arenimonas sp.]
MNAPVKQGWFARHWPWALASGCLVMVVLLVGAMLALGAFAFSLLRSSDVYQQALAFARGNPVVIERVGIPLQPGWLVTGSIRHDGSGGHAELVMPLSGPHADAKLFVEAELQAGRWEFRHVWLTLAGDSVSLDLLSTAGTAIEAESIPGDGELLEEATPLERE